MCEGDDTLGGMTDLETSGFVDGGTARGVKLHSGYSVLIATFLGSPMAGCIVMAINFFRLGMKRQGWLTLLGGLGATGLLIAAACAVPDSWHGSNIAFLALQMGGMSFAANKLQGGILKEHTDAGGVLASRWKAAGIGLLMCVVLFGSIIGVAFLTTGPSGTRMAVGSSEIYFSGSATKADAEALATDL